MEESFPKEMQEEREKNVEDKMEYLTKIRYGSYGKVYEDYYLSGEEE